MEAYLDELLSIELPPRENPEVEESGVVTTVMCISLQSFGFIYSLAKARIEELKLNYQSFAKYVNRITQFIETPPNGKRLLQPEETFFRPATRPAQGPKESAHYIVLQDYYFTDNNDSFVCPEEWQNLLCRLMQELNMESYYEKSVHGPQMDNGAEVLRDMLTQAQEFPELFLVCTSKLTKVKLLATLLKKSIAGRKEGLVSAAEILELSEMYNKYIVGQADLQEKIEQHMRSVISSTLAHCCRIREANDRLQGDIVPGVFASRILEAKGKFVFTIERIDKSATGSPKAKKPQPTISSTVLETKTK